MSQLSDGQYGYYEPGDTHRQLCEVQNGCVYFLHHDRVRRVDEYPGRFVRLGDKSLFPAPEWNEHPWANYAWLESFDDSNYITYAEWIYCADEPAFDKERDGYLYKSGVWQEVYISYESPPQDVSWSKLLAKRPVATATTQPSGADSCHQ